MADIPAPTDSNSPSGSESQQQQPEPRQSLRDVVESSYDQVADSPEPTEPSEPAGQSDRVRDKQGRFVAKGEGGEPGEAEPRAPSPEKVSEAKQPPPEPAPAGSSTPPMEHWSAEDRQIFDKLPPDAKTMFARRYSEMEADYTRKSQLNAGAVQFATALAPIFSDPDIAGALQQIEQHPAQAIQEWGQMYKRSLSPEPRNRVALLVEMAQRMGFDPALLFNTGRQSGQAPPQLSEKDAADPAVRYFADQFGRLNNDHIALRRELETIRQAEATKSQQEQLQFVRGHIDRFADEKGSDGKPLRPDFDQHLPYILELFAANPQRDLGEAYETARRMNPQTWEEMVASERQRMQSEQSVSRAQAAARGNVRGVTSPVSKPNAKTGNGSLRDALEASADEIGF